MNIKLEASMKTITTIGRRTAIAIATICVIACSTSSVFAQRISAETISNIDRAMKDELDRSKEKLHLAGLVDPFFFSYTVDDNLRTDVSATFGALTRSNEIHTRTLNLRLLVNNYQFNDENFTDASSIFGGGGAAIDMNLPLDDDYGIMRRSFWLATDNLFKEANETFTKKKAALERKQLSDEDKNLPDFSPAPKVEILEDPVNVTADRSSFENIARTLSAIFVQYPLVQNCSVSIFFDNNYEFLLNSEGTHTRVPSVTCELTVQATAQAVDDGEPLSLSFTITEPSIVNLPSLDALKARVEKLAHDLVSVAKAHKYSDKEYSGPVLFEDQAANDFFSDQIISKFAAKREDVLGGESFFMGSSKGPSFQKKLETRILPASVNVIDWPTNPQYKTMSLLGKYDVDGEGVVPGKLQLVKDGILKTLYMSRTPTKEVKDPNGHSRAGTVGAGVVEITDAKAKKLADLRKELLKIAKEDGYDFAIVVRSTQQGLLNFTEGLSNVGDLISGGKSIQPSLIYKVYADGHEEPVRGLEITFPSIRDLKELQFSKETSTRNLQLAGGSSANLFGFASKVPGTLIAPIAMLAPELDVHKKQSEAFPIKPIVEKP